MYSVTKFQDRQMMAFSVPPPAHKDLSEDFKELSRIHFYLGYASIDHMIKAVEDASLKDIEKGKVQLFFATKEIQEYLSKTSNYPNVFANKALDPSYCFQKTFAFDDILDQTLKMLTNSYKSPTKKNNVEIIETMIGLTHEVIYLHQELTKINVNTNIEKLEEVKSQYNKVYNLIPNYENLTSLKKFDEYADNAKNSVLNQLKFPYQFNFSEMAKTLYSDEGDWMSSLHYLLDEIKEINEKENVVNNKNTQELKDNFLKHIGSFNSLLKNGVVNYVNSFSASISREIYITIRKSMISAEEYFNKEISYHTESLKRGSRSDSYHKEQIKELEETKESFIKQKLDDKIFYEKYLTALYRQEKNISYSLDQVKANVLNFNLKDTLTFEGDIQTGFVIGKFSNENKVILLHKDNCVSVSEAIYAIIMKKEEYEELVKTNKLVFTKELRETHFSNSSNFWSYGQFLEEVKSSYVQHFFLGKEFDLIDNTILDLKKQEKKLKVA